MPLPPYSQCRRTLRLYSLSSRMSLSSLSLGSNPRISVGGPYNRRYPPLHHPRSFVSFSAKRTTVSASLSVTADSAATESLGRIGSLSQVSGVLGCQWGDEGKGKLVDILAQHFDIVARCQVKLTFLLINSSSGVNLS